MDDVNEIAITEVRSMENLRISHNHTCARHGMACNEIIASSDGDVRVPTNMRALDVRAPSE